MTDDTVEIPMSLPLDDDGFLRRECPTCEREFKGLVAQEGDEEDAATDPAGIYCPYCVIQAPMDSWWTQAQLEHATGLAQQQIVAPMLDDFAKSLGKSSGGFLKMDVKRSKTPEPLELSEANDMRRVEFACHPDESIKVLDDWAGPVHCLVCGTPS